MWVDPLLCPPSWSFVGWSDILARNIEGDISPIARIDEGWGLVGDAYSLNIPEEEGRYIRISNKTQSVSYKDNKGDNMPVENASVSI